MRRNVNRSKWKPLKILLICVIMALLGLGIVFGFQYVNRWMWGRANSEIVKPYYEQYDVLELKRELDKSGIAYEKFEISSDSARASIVIEDGPRVLFSPKKDAVWQVSSLQNLLSRLTIENRKPKTIDLRFDKPIVRF